MAESAKRKAQKAEWKKQNTVQKITQFLKSTDADILEHLDKVLKEKPYNTYIKELIRKDIAQ